MIEKIRGEQIGNSEILTENIGDNSIVTSKIAPNSIENFHIKNNAIESNHISGNSIISSHLSQDAKTSIQDMIENNKISIQTTMSLDQNVLATTWTKVKFDTILSDPRNEYNNTLYRYIASKNGTYNINSAVRWAPQVDQVVDSYAVYINGTRAYISTVTISAKNNSNVSPMSIGSYSTKLHVGDYVEVFVYSSVDSILKTADSYFNITQV